MKIINFEKKKWSLIIFIFIAGIVFEYSYHVIVGGDAFSTIFPEMIFFGLVILAVIFWSFNKLKAQQLQLQNYSLSLEKMVEERTKQLKESEERMRGLVETSTDAIISANDSGKIILWNKAAEKIFDYKEEEIIDKPLTVIMPREYVEAHLKGFKRYLEKGKPRVIGKTVELEGLRKDGSKFPIELSLSSLKTNTGHVFTAVIRDITQKKSSEERLKKYANKLEHSNMLKELFTDIMRHDLQNPVTVIKGISGVLMLEDVPPTMKEALERINNNAKKLERMIDNASIYAKLDSMEKLEFENIDLNRVVKEVITSFKPFLEEKNMKISFKSDGAKSVMAHPVIEDALTNLISNAVKYGPPDSEIIVEIIDKGGEWWIAVKDRGDGVPDEHKETIFNRFERLGKKGVKGTGLGLAIVKRIADLHGGRVWVEDNIIEQRDERGGRIKKKQGSVFYFAIPKLESEVQTVSD